MTEYLFENNAESTLAAELGGGDSSFSVASGEGALFPAVTAASGKGFYIRVKEGSTLEWMLVTARATDALTVTRSGSNSFSEGAEVKLIPNATILGQFLQKAVFRTVTTSPDGSLAADYAGEEVYDSVAEKWYKQTTGTTWKEMAA